jgi:hypothetical protein
MTRILRKSAGSYVLTLLLLCSAALFAADSDESLIERLEAAETPGFTCFTSAPLSGYRKPVARGPARRCARREHRDTGHRVPGEP